MPKSKQSQPRLWLKYIYLAALTQYIGSLVWVASLPPSESRDMELLGIALALSFPISIVAWSYDVWRTIPVEYRKMRGVTTMTPGATLWLFVPIAQLVFIPLHAHGLIGSMASWESAHARTPTLPRWIAVTTATLSIVAWPLSIPFWIWLVFRIDRLRVELANASAADELARVFE